MGYRARPGTKVYRLTRMLQGYETHKYFPATEDGLDAAMRAMRRGRNRGSGQQYGQIHLVEMPATAGK